MSVTGVTPSLMNNVPWVGSGRLRIVKLETVPSVSEPLRLEMVLGPAPTLITGFVTSSALGGLLPTGIVTVAGVASTAPLSSVVVYVKLEVPVNVPVGSNFRPAASAGVKTCPSVTGVMPSAKYRTPWLGSGKLEIV